jgi:hypothetical protein
MPVVRPLLRTAVIAPVRATTRRKRGEIMIRMSRFLAVLMVASTVAACDGPGDGASNGQTGDLTCGAVGCSTGVNLSFDGLDAGATYQIVVAVVEPVYGAVPIAECMLVPEPGASPRLYCSCGENHRESGNILNIEDTSLQQIQVTVSTNGTQVVQQTVDVAYTSSESNGPGCGVCTQTGIIRVGP